jgi:NADPH:quinone reductase
MGGQPTAPGRGWTVKAVAARLVEHGKPLKVAQVDVPAPRRGEVEVDMLYAGVNPIDRLRALGAVEADAPVPRILGAEGAGTVHDRRVVVFGHGVATSRDGVWATRAVVPDSALVDVPAGLDLQDAAVMGVTGVTAWRTTTALARVTAADRVLVLGASGAVGSVIVSIVHGIGATVWGHSHAPGSTEWLRSVGADWVVTGNADDLAGLVEELRPTVVFDPLGDGFTGAAIRALAPSGRLVTFGVSAGETGTIPLRTLYRSGLRIFGYNELAESDEVRSTALAEALRALADGKLSVRIARVLPLAQVNEAFDLLADRHVHGKLVLDLHG